MLNTMRSCLICAMQGQASWLVRAHFPSRELLYLASCAVATAPFQVRL